ncbi:hypothetical protein HQ305_02825 [Rhodococcus sp. BP-149]|uniref:DUF6319 family protein n=1 Tax=unclassified Rhodococcus (in: high G+C Gram-positive bacteria) TaxID=192944 RepID=UPI001C9AA95C|nr:MULTISPECIES: DUF6319 family protein [unclassified Rhodococcus (in: high G+C Gram-positive bacteria)]MBY6684646.1 hypothetical protein [Rhodococcus sp. BP-288]MBY6698768.1 hypothetical protein [Rhodococcus sp. BP-285]MBY6701447.1 hypothetical protein [Rhodococcus sp. BP-283]MBY6712448.1 hypothetical protein [Rhodococcus sp. BP-160]MBY6719696.1 hypothetical protein [Rhodococcus sp. BP-142]
MSAPARRRAPRPGEALSAEDLSTLEAGLAAGRRVTVYLREATPSLGLEAGASARVISVDGTTVTVSPKGIDDQLPYEADELRLSKDAPAPARKATKVAPRTTAARPTTRPAVVPPPVVPHAATPRSETPVPVKAAPEKSVATPALAPETSVKPAARPARRTKAQPAPVSVTVTSGPDDQWTVTVSHGAKKLAKPSDVTADRVLRAIRELGDDVASAAVEDKIEAARAAALERVEALSRELDEARRALDRLKNE